MFPKKVRSVGKERKPNRPVLLGHVDTADVSVGSRFIDPIVLRDAESMTSSVTQDEGVQADPECTSVEVSTESERVVLVQDSL